MDSANPYQRLCLRKETGPSQKHGGLWWEPRPLTASVSMVISISSSSTWYEQLYLSHSSINCGKADLDKSSNSTSLQIAMGEHFLCKNSGATQAIGPDNVTKLSCLVIYFSLSLHTSFPPLWPPWSLLYLQDWGSAQGHRCQPFHRKRHAWKAVQWRIQGLPQGSPVPFGLMTLKSK